MAHQIKDEKQEYQYSGGFTTPAGHEFQYYDTPENERMILKHSSGSHVEFKADGSVMIKSLKDLHLHSSIVSAASDDQQGASQGSDVTTNVIGTNYTIECLGALKIKARSIQIEGHDTIHMLAGTDLEMKASNTWVRAKEQVAVEGTQSIRMDSNECTQAFRTLRQDIGTEEGEDGKKGGLHKIKNHGTFIIEQSDETAAMTIRSKGYLNLIAGQERVDIVGKYEEKPSTVAQEGKATWVQKVVKPEKPDQNNVSKEKPGDLYLYTEAGITNMLGQVRRGSSLNMEDGRHVDIKMGNDILTIHDGDRKETLMKGDDDEIMMQGDKSLVMQDGDHEHTQANGDKKLLVNGNEDKAITGSVTETAGNGKKEINGNSHLEKVCKGSGTGGGGGAFDADVTLDDCELYRCPGNSIPPTIPSFPSILPEDDSAQGDNGGDDDGGGGGGGGMPSIPIGTLMQLLCGNFMNFADQLNIQKSTKIFLN